VKKKDGSNCPFTVSSMLELDNLKIVIAEKLHCFPGLLKLRYRLDTDKQKAAATSIQTTDEYAIFKNKMRSLIVPQRLPSGKLSTRVLKPVTVSFEDGADDNGVYNPSNSSQKSDKKVCSIFFSVLLLLKVYRRQRRRPNQV
jgi:hypothetical protein